MNINLTLIGQMIAFVGFVLFCMKYVWPPIRQVYRGEAERVPPTFRSFSNLVPVAVPSLVQSSVPALSSLAANRKPPGAAVM